MFIMLETFSQTSKQTIRGTSSNLPVPHLSPVRVRTAHCHPLLEGGAGGHPQTDCHGVPEPGDPIHADGEVVPVDTCVPPQTGGHGLRTWAPLNPLLSQQHLPQRAAGGPVVTSSEGFSVNKGQLAEGGTQLSMWCLPSLSPVCTFLGLLVTGRTQRNSPTSSEKGAVWK